MKLARVFYCLTPEKWIDFPIADGNTFAGFILQFRTQGFVLDSSLNAYVDFGAVKVAFQLETDALNTTGMTKQ